MTDDRNWLIATAGVCLIMLAFYVLGTVRKRKNFDLNSVVPLLLSGAATIAACKMIVLSFALTSLLAGSKVVSLFDSASIFVGGLVFFSTALYGSIQLIVTAFSDAS
jgi:hypothetical protein